MSNNKTVLVIHHEPERYFEDLRIRFPQRSFYTARNDSEVAERMVEHKPDILLSFRCDSISTEVQSRAARESSVQWIQVAGVGYNHIGDLQQLRCTVTNCAGILSRYQAETVIGAMINLNFGFYRYQQQQQEKIYRKLPWRSLEGQRLLLIGFGRIGQAVAKMAKHFDMHVTAVRSRIQESPDADEVYTPEKLPTLLPKADFVSLHLPYNGSTHHFFTAEMLMGMKKSAYLINTARGKVVDEDALIAALKNGEIAGAYLDVFSREPLPVSSPLWELKNVIMSPHYCDSVVDWHERFAGFFADNLERWLKGEKLQNTVKV